MSFKKVKPGHRLYEVDVRTGGIALAEINNEPVKRKVNEVKEVELKLRQGVVRFYEREGCLYFSALNIASVRKQYSNLVQKLSHGKYKAHGV